MRSVESDPQIDDLHAAESEFYTKRKGRYDYAGRLTQKEARQLIAEVRQQFGLPRVSLRCLKLKNSPHGAHAVHDVDENEEVVSSLITFTGVNPLCAHTLLHELAHVITNYFFGMHVEDHGAEFVGVMCWLFDYYRIIPRDAFGLILRRHGVKRRPVGLCTPEFLRKFREKRLT